MVVLLSKDKTVCRGLPRLALTVTGADDAQQQVHMVGGKGACREKMTNSQAVGAVEKNMA